MRLDITINEMCVCINVQSTMFMCSQINNRKSTRMINILFISHLFCGEKRDKQTKINSLSWLFSVSVGPLYSIQTVCVRGIWYISNRYCWRVYRYTSEKPKGKYLIKAASTVRCFFVFKMKFMLHIERQQNRSHIR